MDKKIALLAIIVTDVEKIDQVNLLLHAYRDFVIGRMGIPYRERGVNVISIALDAPQETINSLSGKLGMISGVSSKVLVTK
ncbi:MAG: iron-only hydrogenase system regulator [Clostridia bacterium]|nr:iron-only hydrogenase system regulator [Clostridia bacterium]